MADEIQIQLPLYQSRINDCNVRIGLTIMLGVAWMRILKIMYCLFGVSHCSCFWIVECHPHINQLSYNQFIPRENQMHPTLGFVLLC